MKTTFRPAAPSFAAKAAAMAFYSPAGVSAPAAYSDDFARSPEGQAMMTADSHRAIELADKAKFAEIERHTEEAGFRSDPDFRTFEARDEQRQVADPAAFMKGGNATFTLVSKATGTRFTYKVRQPDASKPHFVMVLTGSDNESDYAFLGTIFADGTYRRSHKSSIGPAAPSAKAFQWLHDHLLDPALSAKCEIWHEGRCCKCGRKLTVPSSIESGIGPECAKRD